MKRIIALFCCLILVFCLMSTPASAAGAWTHIIDVVCVNGATIALRDDGRVLYTGDPAIPASRDVGSWSNIEWIEAVGSDYLVGYRASGEVFLTLLRVPYDSSDLPFRQADVADWTDVRKLVISGDFCYGLCYDGSFYWVVYGQDAYATAQITNSWPSLVDVATDGYGMVAGLTADGNVLCTDPAALTNAGGYWGSDPLRASDWSRVSEIYCNGFGLYGVRSDRVLGIGRSGWNNVRSLYFAPDSMFGLRYDGSVAANFSEYFSTDDRLQQIDRWRGIVQLGFDGSGGFRYVPVGLKSDGTIAAVTTFDGYSYGEWDFSGWSGITELYSGTEYTIGQRSDGSLLVTGGEFDTLDYLGQVGQWRNVRAVFPAKGEYTDHIVALLTDGTLVAAGDNSYGQCNVG